MSVLIATLFLIPAAEVAAEGTVAACYMLLAVHAHVAAQGVCVLYIVICLAVTARVLFGYFRVRRILRRSFTAGAGPSPAP